MELGLALDWSTLSAIVVPLLIGIAYFRRVAKELLQIDSVSPMRRMTSPRSSGSVPRPRLFLQRGGTFAVCRRRP